MGDRVLRVRGDRDHPLSRGYTCPKGRALPQLHHHPDRLLEPLIRRDGALVPAGWEECLDDLGGRLSAIIERHGPASVGIFFGSGNGFDAAGFRMSQALLAAIGTPARFTPMTIDGAAKTLVEVLMAGVPGLHTCPDYERADLLLYIGINPIISHGHIIGFPNPALAIRDIVRRGELWVIDPRRTETADLATRHIAPVPGSDYAILAFLVRQLLRDGADLDRLHRHCTGVDALSEAVAPYDLDRAADLSGVPAADLAALLASVRRAGRIAIDTGTGATMPATANLTQWLAWALLIVTDSMNRSGGVWFHPGFLRPRDVAPIAPIDDPFGPGPPSRPDLRSFVGDWPCAALADEIEGGNIRALLNFGGAIMRSFPDANRLRPALDKLELFASLDIIANDTTRLSTHVLPARDQLERPDMTIWDTICPRVNMHYSPAIVATAGNRRSAWWIIAQLMRRLGHEPPGTLPVDDFVPGADDSMLAAQMNGARCTFEELAAKRYVELPHELPAPWVDAHIDRIGGWRLAPDPLVEQLAAASGHTPPLSLIPRRQRRHLNAYMLFLGDDPEILLNPADAEAAGIADGQSVTVRTASGELTGKARTDERMRPGVVSVPHGFEAANVNLLTDAKVADPLTGMALYGALAVEVAGA